MNRIFACLLCMGLVAGVSDRGAAESDGSDFDQTGAYLAAGAAFGLTTQIENTLKDELEAMGMSGVDVEQDWIYGYKVRAGWRYHAAGAVEAEFERGTESTLAIQGQPNIESNSWAAMLNFKLYPLGGRFQPYALFGAGVLFVDWDDPRPEDIGLKGTSTEAAVRFGAGLDAYATENVFLFADASYVLPTDTLRKYDYASFGIGVGYRW